MKPRIHTPLLGFDRERWDPQTASACALRIGVANFPYMASETEWLAASHRVVLVATILGSTCESMANSCLKGDLTGLTLQAYRVSLANGVTKGTCRMECEHPTDSHR